VRDPVLIGPFSGPDPSANNELSADMEAPTMLNTASSKAEQAGDSTSLVWLRRAYRLRSGAPAHRLVGSADRLERAGR
jgi:hypothetical protein